MFEVIVTRNKYNLCTLFSAFSIFLLITLSLISVKIRYVGGTMRILSSLKKSKQA